MSTSPNNQRDRHALPPSIVAKRSSRFGDHQSVRESLTRLPRVPVDSHFNMLGDEDYTRELRALASAEPAYVDTAIGEMLTLSPSQQSAEGLLRCMTWERSFFEHAQVMDDTDAWRERVRNAEREGACVPRKRTWSKRLSDGVVGFGAKVARRVASVWRKDSGFDSVALNVGEFAPSETLLERSSPRGREAEDPSEPPATQNQSEWTAPTNLARKSETPAPVLLASDQDANPVVENGADCEVASIYSEEGYQDLTQRRIEPELERRFSQCDGNTTTEAAQIEASILHKEEIEEEQSGSAREFRLFQELQAGQLSPFRGRTISDRMTHRQLGQLVEDCWYIDDLAREIL